ncbi:MAG: ABC transporter ATP-binding protein [Candidatus Atribacteria bacterium]|nr:ABC transporter ATP-binding protein [Candidatus Atribacteria bacterium]
MLLEVNGLSAGYKGTTVLVDISLKINKGEFVSIVGSNGAGKSTLLRTISGLIKPTAGEIKFNGKRIDGQDPAQISTTNRIAHIPEGRMLFPRMTVFQNLQLGAYIIKEKSKREEILERIFGLFPRMHERRSQLAGTLSGGEQQMLAISRGLMMDPSFLMLDEPSLGVQPNIVTLIYETLELINKQGITVLLVEQNIQDSLRMADRAYVIQTGKIIAEGKGRELLSSELVRKAYLGI